MATKDNIIIGLDVGSSFIRLVAAQLPDDQTTDSVQVIGAIEVQSEGISRGMITNSEDMISSLSQAIEKMERMIGLPVERVVVGIPGSALLPTETHGVVAVSRPNGEINEQDVERVVEASQAVSQPPNHEILHVIPQNFAVDQQAGVKDPVGMTGVRLEVRALLISGLVSYIKNLTRCIYRTGVDISDLVANTLAAAESVLEKQDKDLGVLLIDIGTSSSSFVVYEEGNILRLGSVPIGSRHITQDIAIGLRVSIDLAERIKIEYGHALPQEIKKGELLDLEELGGESASVSRHEVAEIIEARVEEIFSLIDKELKKIDRSGKLPGGVVLCGGGAKLSGIIDVAKETFRLPVRLGLPQRFESPLGRINDTAFATAIGLVLWGLHGAKVNHQLSNYFSSVSETTSKIKGWFKQLLP